MVSKHLNFEIVVSKRNTLLQISFYHWLSSLYHHWFMEYNFGPILTQLWVNDVTTGVKPTIFLRKRSQKKTYSFIKLILSPQSFIKYWFQSIYHPWYMIYNFGNNLEIMTSQMTQIFKNFEKINWKIRFDLLKMQMAGSVEVSIVVRLPCITLKLFRQALENDAIKGPLFHTFHQHFTNILQF